MTVLVWDGKTLASDSRTTAGDDIVSDIAPKIYCLKDQEVDYMGDKIEAIAIAGRCSDSDRLLSFILTEGFGGELEHRTNAILVGKKYVYSLEEKTTWLIRYNKSHKIAEGSGCVWALSALRLGLDSVSAARHAVKNCTSCGGKISTWPKSKDKK